MVTNHACFVCGTDTNVGKTVVCSGLLKNMANAYGLKVIQTGATLADQQTYQKAVIGNQTETLYHFPLPASPHLAAKEVDASLDLNEIINAVKNRVDNHEFTLIESSGGIMTPVTEEATFLDLMTALDYPVLLVVKNVLGAINQALLSIQALRHRGIKIIGLVMNQPVALTDEELFIVQDNARLLAHKSGVPILATLPFMADFQEEEPHWQQVAQALKQAAQQLTQPQPKIDDALIQFDQNHLWHPYEDAVSSAKPLVKSAKGMRLMLSNGQSVIDGVSSWWSVIHGYSHPQLIEAIQQQSATLSHVMFGGLTHQPAITLTKKLLEIVPKGLQHAFFTDSGSVAVEAAIKMAQQYWHGQGYPNKNKLISFGGGYHGDTYGTMAVSDPDGGMHTIFDASIAQNIFTEKPTIAFNQTFDAAELESLEKLIKAHHHECCAMIMEPILQGAGGIRLYHPEYLKAARQLCDRYNLLLIIDEIASGFGRTGKLFACEWADIRPDILCLGKALTGGMLTLAATLTTAEVAKGIAASGAPLMHGPTFTANPLACHVAATSIDLLLQSDWQKNVLQIEGWLKQGLEICREHPDVKEIRVLGAIGVIELKSAVNSAALQRYFLKQGVWIRPFKNVIYVMPPYIATEQDIHCLTQAMVRAVEEKAWA